MSDWNPAKTTCSLAPSAAGGYRVLWLGDPSVLPTPGWTVAPGLALATSQNGLPGGATAFTPPDSGATDALIQAVQAALRGQTVDLGSLLAPAGISTIVFTGIATEMGIESSAREAGNRGFFPVVVSDCVSSSSKDNHMRSLDNMRSLMPIVSAGDLLGLWK